MVRNVLSTDAWMGDVNFGGEANAQTFLTLLAGGIYAVPPEAEPFPGADLIAAHAAVS
jgi:hypothetical protein